VDSAASGDDGRQRLRACSKAKQAPEVLTDLVEPRCSGAKAPPTLELREGTAPAIGIAGSSAGITLIATVRPKRVSRRDDLAIRRRRSVEDFAPEDSGIDWRRCPDGSANL
jgi:hypothetical protein